MMITNATLSGQYRRAASVSATHAMARDRWNQTRAFMFTPACALRGQVPYADADADGHGDCVAVAVADRARPIVQSGCSNFVDPTAVAGDVVDQHDDRVGWVHSGRRPADDRGVDADRAPERAT